MNESEISEEELEKLLDESPKTVYHLGSGSVKKIYNSLKMTKILRLIFIELYHNEKIREFFSQEIITKPIMFWTSFFQRLIDKQIIRSQDPKELAENYYNYCMFKMFEVIILKYPDDPQELNLDEIFDNMEDHFNFILSAVAINN